MSYITLITNTGLAKVTAALSGGTQVSMGQIAIGDGNGFTVAPTQNQTELVNELYRANANQIGINGEGKLVAELVIPQSIGGFTIREIGLYDSDGELFAVGSTPSIQKPAVEENAAAELVIRLIVTVSNTAVIELTSSNLILATRDWVEANFAIDSLFPGGTTGQVLRKSSNLDGDTEWADPTEVSVTVNTVEETQTLTGSQTIVNLVNVDTSGIAVYVNGLRLPKTAYTINSMTRITLGQTYANGSIITVVQNEPAAQIQTVMVGQIIMLGLSTHPADLFGYGTWSQVGQGRAIFGLNGSDVDFNTLGKTGGQKFHAHSGTTETAGAHNHSGTTAAGGDHNHSGSTGQAGAHNHSGNTGGTALTIDQIPSHTHQMEAGVTAAGYITGTVDGNANESGMVTTNATGGGQAHSHTISSESSHAHTVASSGTHTHGINNDGTHSHVLNTAQTTSLPPYYTVALWQRMS